MSQEALRKQWRRRRTLCTSTTSQLSMATMGLLLSIIIHFFTSLHSPVSGPDGSSNGARIRKISAKRQISLCSATLPTNPLVGSAEYWCGARSRGYARAEYMKTMLGKSTMLWFPVRNSAFVELPNTACKGLIHITNSWILPFNVDLTLAEKIRSGPSVANWLKEPTRWQGEIDFSHIPSGMGMSSEKGLKSKGRDRDGNVDRRLKDKKFLRDQPLEKMTAERFFSKSKKKKKWEETILQGSSKERGAKYK